MGNLELIQLNNFTKDILLLCCLKLVTFFDCRHIEMWFPVGCNTSRHHGCIQSKSSWEMLIKMGFSSGGFLSFFLFFPTKEEK